MTKKKLSRFGLLAAASALSAAFVLSVTACGGTPATPPAPPPDLGELKSISLTYLPNDTYVKGETVREPNNTLKLTYENGTASIALTDPAVSITGDTSTTGEHKGKISYEGYDIEFDYTVYDSLEDTVTVEGGTVRGYTKNGVEIYKGIPFAAPPVGNLRWRAPQDVEPWDDVLDCYQFGPAPIQNVRSNNAQLIDPWAGTSEDCLTLNVWTNGRETEQETAGKPVLVYIYGGGYTAGGGSVPIYDGEAIAEQDVVYVSFNYRLGAFGFLATDELKAENDGCGNFAILDQIKALEWVQDNIAAFGGDPSNVTIMGQSAGAMSVEALLASPLAEGLFQNAAILSAGMYFLSDLSDMDAAIASTNLRSEYTLAQLRGMTAEEVQTAIKSNNTNVVYDNYVITSPSTKVAFEKGDNPSTKNVNVMVGNVTGDTTLYAEKRALEAGELEDGAIAQRTLLVNALRLDEGRTASAWQYHYTYVQKGTLSAGHTDDVPYWLGITTSKFRDYSANDIAMAELCSGYLVNFCYTGNPNNGPVSSLPAWNESTGDYGYMFLNNPSTAAYTHLSDDVIAAFEKAYAEFSKYFPVI